MNRDMNLIKKAPLQSCYVHVTGTTGRFIEFEFSIGEPELSIEMVLPHEAFEEFCVRHTTRTLSAAEALQLEHERQKWRYGAPGIAE